MRTCRAVSAALIAGVLWSLLSSFGRILSASATDAGRSRPGQLCRRIRILVCDNYAFIAARSGWIPAIFATLVRRKPDRAGSIQNTNTPNRNNSAACFQVLYYF
jgi:hypothetical protein